MARTPKYFNVGLDNGIITLELNRPEKLNAISPEMATEMRELVEDYGYRPEARVLVIKGAGSSFCAGYDVVTSLRADSVQGRWLESAGFQQAFEAVAAVPVVKIAQLRGHVVGAGLLLAATCDLRYATADTRFFIPELDMGIPFSLGGVAHMTRLLGLTRVADMVLNCTPMLANDPNAGGLVTELVTADELDARVAAVAARLSRRPSVLLLSTLNTLREARDKLLPPATNDLFTMFFNEDDEEARAVKDEYVQRFSAKK